MTDVTPRAGIDVQLAKLRPLWMNWLRLRHRSLVHAHDDIVQDATVDLIAYVSKDAQRKRSEEEIRKIGFTILQRRVADRFRAGVLEWAEHSQPDELPSTDSSSDLDRALAYRKLLRAVMSMLAQLDGPSRDLLLGDEAIGPDAAAPLSAAQRQRLSRLRAELRRQLEEKYNIDVRRLLRE